MAKQSYTAEQVVNALKETKGMIYLAAKRLGCSHQTIYNYAKRYKVVQDTIDSQSGEVGDLAELKLYQAIQSGDLKAVAFYLSTKGKSRGYTSKQEVEHSGRVDVRQLSDDELRAIIES